MRFVHLVGCAAALVACADSNPTVPSNSRPLPRTAGVSADPRSAKDKIDPRSLPDRLEALVNQQLEKVSIPPDDFSLASDAVHPDVACPPGRWNGAACWFMYTPYRNSDPSYENPALLRSSSNTFWETPTDIRNPIVGYPGFEKYNSDPDHAFDPVTGRMVQVYRVVADSFNKIMIMSTANAKTWTTASIAFRERNHDAVSPSLLIESDRRAKIWYVRTGVDGCNSPATTVLLRTALPDSSSGYERSAWSPPVPVGLSIPGYVVWHLDVAPMGKGRGYVSLVVGFAKGGSCNFSELWLATSPDGVSWRTYPMPVLWRTMALAKKRSISTWYRGTLRYDAGSDSLHLWPSALASRTWTVYHTVAKLSDLVGLLQALQPADFRSALLSYKPQAPTIPMP